MCGRFSLGATIRVGQLFDLPNWPDVSPRYNIAPSQDAPAVVRLRETPHRQFRPLRWGLVPSWSEDRTIGARLINARAETLGAKPAFRELLRERRCLILADGFYEWQPQGRRKQPWYVRMRDGRPFAFAGLWDRWHSAAKDQLETCAIVTTEPNTLVSGLHNRMPAILPPTDYDLWLDPGFQEVGHLIAVLRPYPPDEMTAYPVSMRVNNAAYDDPACVAPLATGEAPGL